MCTKFCSCWCCCAWWSEGLLVLSICNCEFMIEVTAILLLQVDTKRNSVACLAPWFQLQYLWVCHPQKNLSSRGAKKICRKKILGAQVWWWNSVKWNLKGRMESAPVIRYSSKSKKNWGATQNSDQFLDSMQKGANWGAQVCWWIRLNWIWREKWQLPAPVILSFFEEE